MVLLGKMHPLSVKGMTVGGATASINATGGQIRCPRPLIKKESTQLGEGDVRQPDTQGSV
jgi:hypothetical protein